MHYRRKMAGLTQQEASKAIGVDQSMISLWERDVIIPKTDNLYAMAKVYKCEITDFWAVNLDYLKELGDAVILDYLSDKSYPKDGKARLVKSLHDINMPQETQIETDTSTLALDYWKKDTILPFNSDACIDFWEFKGDEIIIRGPARCGKSTLILEYVICKMMQNEGMEVQIDRAFSVDLDAVRQNIRDICKYHFADPLSPIEAIGGNKFDKLKINGGTLTLKGIDRAGGQLGAGFDLVVHSQAEQIKKENIDIINSRCTPLSNRWIEDGQSRSLVIYDVNPNRTDHYIEELIKPTDDDKDPVKIIEFDFSDHPLYFDEEGNETDAYKKVFSRLDRLDGVWRKRLLEGKAANPEGTIFSIEECHLLEQLPRDFLTRNLYYRGMDFGMKSPSVCLWVSKHRATGDLIVYREWRKTKTDIINMGDDVKRYSDERVTSTVIDNDENRQKTLLSHCGMPTVMATKGPNSVASGISLIQHRLQLTREGKEGGIYFFDNPVIRDPNLIRENQPLTILDEAELYSWNDNTDKPIDKHNHAWDALAYILDMLENEKPTVGFGTGTATRQKRM